MSASLLILVCDHRGEGLQESLSVLVPAGYQVELARNVRETREKMAALEPDVIVLDPLVEGGRTEIEEILRSRQAGAHPPLLLVVDTNNLEPALEALARIEEASFDWLQRGARAEEFRLRIERLVELNSKKVEIEELRHRALHDERTDLLRPAAFQQRLLEHFSAAERHRQHMALVLIDLDRFGSINKRYDHTVGDRIIAKVGDAIRSTLRAEDVAGRLGGDEFAVLLPYTRRVDAARVATRLRERIQGVSLTPTILSEPVQVSASLGFETFDGTDLEDVDKLRANAESALRMAKNAGGNRCVYFRSMRRV
jgi:diguanylate cyclase (GGDEF)-like protein